MLKNRPPNSSRNTGSHLTMLGLFQAVFYSVIWLWNEYVATYVTIIFPGMILLLLLLSAIADWIEPSRIPAWYYKAMLISAIIPVIIGAVFYFIYDGQFDFLNSI